MLRFSAADDVSMSTGAETQALPRVQSRVVAGSDTEVAAPDPDAQVAAPDPAEAADEESVQQLYEAGLAKLHALHDHWAAAVAEVREAQLAAA